MNKELKVVRFTGTEDAVNITERKDVKSRLRVVGLKPQVPTQPAPRERHRFVTAYKNMIIQLECDEKAKLLHKPKKPSLSDKSGKRLY